MIKPLGKLIKLGIKTLIKLSYTYYIYINNYVNNYFLTINPSRIKYYHV